MLEKRGKGTLSKLGNCCQDQLVGVNDALCFTINLTNTGGSPIPIWDDATSFNINGTILIENKGVIGASPTAALVVNGTPVAGFIVGAGEVRSITMSNINSIRITGAGTGTAPVMISFSINYKY